MKKVFVIDNYDSFTYNLVHAIEELLGHEISVRRNDALDWDEIESADYLILSPGPGIPDEAGELKESIRRFAGKMKILGVCLGHQAIGEVFGADLRNLSEVYHGVQTEIYCTQESCKIFEGLERTFAGGRYHSWVVEKDTLPDDLHITCIDDKGEIMGFQHREYDLFGVQFHPESILTPDGIKILQNFLNLSDL